LAGKTREVIKKYNLLQFMPVIRHRREVKRFCRKIQYAVFSKLKSVQRVKGKMAFEQKGGGGGGTIPPKNREMGFRSKERRATGTQPRRKMGLRSRSARVGG